jgi:hypothetical protein
MATERKSELLRGPEVERQCGSTAAQFPNIRRLTTGPPCVAFSWPAREVASCADKEGR